MSALHAADPGLALAVDFGGTKVALAVLDTSGRRRAQGAIPVHADRGAEQAVERTLDEAARLLAGAGAPDGLALRAVGIASPGIVLRDRILLAPNVPGWSELHLAERFEARLGATVRCATDVKAAAFAEATWGHLAGADPGIHLNLGTGLAAAIVIGGEVLTGRHGAAGELGYDLCRPGDACGPHLGLAPLEARAGGRALGEAGRAVGGTGDAASLYALAREPGHPAHAVLQEALQELAIHVVNAVNLIDPARITVGGGQTGASDLIFPILRDHLQRATPFPPELMLARFATDGPLVGAAALALAALGAECSWVEPALSARTPAA